jgi:hypothetical protein
MRRHAWTLLETKKLIENYDRPVQELLEMFPRHSKPSLERKMTRLRQQGKIGFKSAETIREAYRIRDKKAPHDNKPQDS